MQVDQIFKDMTICCIASGPSLTKEDCELIKNAGLVTIAINSTWKIAPFCNYIYAGDGSWWKENLNNITIDAEFWTCAEHVAKQFNLNYHKAQTSGFWNSGMRALQFAVERGAKKIILLGYDCSIKNGIHWHGLHKNTSNPSLVAVKKWNTQFSLVDTKNCEIINCSRYTELKRFKRDKLENQLRC